MCYAWLVQGIKRFITWLDLFPPRNIEIVTLHLKGCWAVIYVQLRPSQTALVKGDKICHLWVWERLGGLVVCDDEPSGFYISPSMLAGELWSPRVSHSRGGLRNTGLAGWLAGWIMISMNISDGAHYSLPAHQLSEIWLQSRHLIRPCSVFPPSPPWYINGPEHENSTWADLSFSPAFQVCDINGTL